MYFSYDNQMEMPNLKLNRRSQPFSRNLIDLNDIWKPLFVKGFIHNCFLCLEALNNKATSGMAER